MADFDGDSDSVFAAIIENGLEEESAPNFIDRLVYELQQPVTAQAHQPPGGEGMLAVYRPISVDAETGDEPDGSREKPLAFLSGMDVYTGKYYTFEGKLYLAKADLIPCVWAPGTPGLWQWEEVE